MATIRALADIRLHETPWPAPLGLASQWRHRRRDVAASQDSPVKILYRRCRLSAAVEPNGRFDCAVAQETADGLVLARVVPKEKARDGMAKQVRVPL